MARDFEFDPEKYAKWEQDERINYIIYVSHKPKEDKKSAYYRCYQRSIERITADANGILNTKIDYSRSIVFKPISKDELLELIRFNPGFFLPEEIIANGILIDDLQSIGLPEDEISRLMGSTLK